MTCIKPVTLDEYGERVLRSAMLGRARREFLTAFQDVWTMPYVVLPRSAHDHGL